jgi:hypothetical protein
MARVSAVKTLEAISETEAARGGYMPAKLPGLTIQIVSGDPAKPAKVIEHDDGSD